MLSQPSLIRRLNNQAKALLREMDLAKIVRQGALAGREARAGNRYIAIKRND